MSRVPAAVVTSVLVIAGLSACATAPASSHADECAPALSGGSSSTAVSVSDDFTVAPDASFTTPLTSAETEATTVIEGAGEVVTAASLPLASFSIYNGENGEEIAATPLESPTVLSALEAQIPSIGSAVSCAREGSRIVVTLSPEESAPFTQPFGATSGAPSASVVAVIDVRDVLPAVAQGTAHPVFTSGLPAVVQDENGRPGINIPSTPPPSSLRITELIEGDGETVATDETILVNAMIVQWEDGALVSSSWESGMPSALSLDAAQQDPMSETFRQMLTDRTAGSRVVAVVPPVSDASAPESQGGPGSMTQIIVLDVLGNIQLPTQ